MKDSRLRAALQATKILFCREMLVGGYLELIYLGDILSSATRSHDVFCYWTLNWSQANCPMQVICSEIYGYESVFT